MSQPDFIAEASSNHGRDLVARARLCRCGRRCRLRRGQIPAVQDRPHVRAGNPVAERQAPRAPRMGIAAGASGAAGRALSRARHPVFLHALLSAKRWRSSRPSSISTRSRPTSCWSTPLLEGLRRNRQAGRAVHRHGDDGRDRGRRRHAEARGRQRHHPAALRLRLSDAGRRKPTVRHRRHPRRHGLRDRLVRSHPQRPP